LSDFGKQSYGYNKEVYEIPFPTKPKWAKNDDFLPRDIKKFTDFNVVEARGH